MMYLLLKIWVDNIFALIDIKQNKEGLQFPLRVEQSICDKWIQNEDLSLYFLWHIQHQTSKGEQTRALNNLQSNIALKL